EGHWKLLCDFDGSRPQLYDLQRDPGETENRAQTDANLAAELTDKVTAWYRSMQEVATKLNQGKQERSTDNK
ncbi:MAG: hypothetical protein N2C12_00965, partial [Planctomycetales bacterium]